MRIPDGPDEISPAANLLGRNVRDIDAESGVIRIDFEAKREFANRHGTVAGGFLAAMLDSATSAPALLAVSDGESVVTTDLRVSFDRPASVGRLTAHSRLVDQDARNVRSESELLDAEGRTVAHATAVFRIISRIG